jgi:hypothetical protein
MPYCENCGKEVAPTTKFCRNCGAPQNVAPGEVQPSPNFPPQEQAQPVSPPPPPPAVIPPPQVQAPQVQAPQVPQAAAPAQPTGNEITIGAIPLRKSKSLGRYDAFTGVLTSRRIIIASMTNDMMKDAIQQARDQAKAQGKGFWGQWSDQLKAGVGHTRNYLTMDPSAILSETPGNFGISNDIIAEVKLELKYIGPQDTERREFEVKIKSTYGKYEFRMDEDNYYVSLLKQVYGDRVKMPFGYFFRPIKIG